MGCVCVCVGISREDLLCFTEYACNGIAGVFRVRRLVVGSALNRYPECTHMTIVLSRHDPTFNLTFCHPDMGNSLDREAEEGNEDDHELCVLCAR